MRKFVAALFSVIGLGASAALAVGPESERWLSFSRQHPGDRASASTVLVDLDLLQWMAMTKDGVEMTISFDLTNPTEHGLPSEAEIASLYLVEDQLANEMKHGGEGRLIGHVFGQGKATYYVYAATADAVLLARLADIVTGLPASTSAQITPITSVSFSQHMLNPSPAEYQIVKDTMVLQQLAANGDIATAPRQIEHWAYFPDRTSADQFAALLGPEGMSVLSVGESAEAVGQVQVYFSHVGSVLPEDISSITVRLDELATRLGGRYDGWATPVIAAE
jgi:hypothetical protein